MAIRKLKEYKLKAVELKAVCTALNESKLATQIKLNNAGEVMLKEFLDAIDSIPSNSTEGIPPEVATYYDALPQAVFDDDVDEVDGNVDDEGDADADGVDEVDDDGDEVDDDGDEVDDDEVDDDDDESDKPEITSECPTFKTGYNPGEEDCQTCEKEFPEEFTACVTECTKLKKEEKAEKKKKASKKGTGKAKAPVQRSRYGHVFGSMTARIDDMIWEGKTKAEMIECLKKEFKRNDNAAKGRIVGHLKRMVRLNVVQLEKRDDEVIKAINEYADGFNADNTSSTL